MKQNWTEIMSSSTLSVKKKKGGGGGGGGGLIIIWHVIYFGQKVVNHAVQWHLSVSSCTAMVKEGFVAI